MRILASGLDFDFPVSMSTRHCGKWLSCPLCLSLSLKGPQWILPCLFKESCLGSPHKHAIPCRQEGVDSKMIIKEYRIPLPMTVEEYRIAQLYMIQVSPERWLDQVKLDGFQCTLVGTVQVCEVLHLGILGSRGIRVSCHHYTPAPIEYLLCVTTCHLASALISGVSPGCCHKLPCPLA